MITELCRVIPGDADPQIVAGEKFAVVGLDIFQGDRFHPGGSAFHHVLVVGAAEKQILQGLLAVFLIGRGADHLVDIILLIDLHPVEIRFVEGRVEDQSLQDRVEFIQEVGRHPEGEDGNFLIHRGAIAGRHREELVLDRAIRHLAIPSLGDGRSCRGGQAFLAGGIADGSVAKHQLDNHFIRIGLLQLDHILGEQGAAEQQADHPYLHHFTPPSASGEIVAIVSPSGTKYFFATMIISSTVT